MLPKRVFVFVASGRRLKSLHEHKDSKSVNGVVSYISYNCYFKINNNLHCPQSVTRRFAIGPVSMIAPFNFPLNLAAHKIAPAIAVGCPWVLKPASRTPLGALMIAEILSRQTDLPIGAFSVLPCQRDGADLFTTDERFKLLSFTGSPDV